MDLENDIIRAEEAARIINHPLYVEAYDKLKQELEQAWINSPSRDVEGRETLWLSLKLLAQTRTHLESLIASGRMAQIELSRRGLR